jgi:hypothetical protein
MSASPSLLRDRPLEDVQRLIDLIGDAGSVELKLTVPEADHRVTVRRLGFDPLDAGLRQVFFFDTPDLALDAQGLVLRARRSQGKKDDSVVKLRPLVPSSLPQYARRSPNFKVEVDASPRDFVCSGSMKHAMKAGTVREATMAGGKALRRMFSPEQRKLIAAHAPAGVALSKLVVLGPLLVLKLTATPKALGRRMACELWLFPDGSRILELSTRCAPAEAFRVAAEARAFLADRGVDLGGEQEAKTRSALSYFAALPPAA